MKIGDRGFLFYRILPVMSILLAAGVVCHSLAGCTLAPQYKRPEPPVASEWPRGQAYEEYTVYQDLPVASQVPWSSFFLDPRLKKVIDIALRSNRDVRTASLTVERVRALYGIQRAELLPAVGATATGAKQKIPSGLMGFPQPLTIEQYGLGLMLSSWEIDFFGRIRSLKDKAFQEYLATQQACYAAQLLLVSSVAYAYMNLAADRDLLALAQKRLEIEQTRYRLMQRLQEVGSATQMDLNMAQASVDAAQAEVWRYTLLAAQDENALTLLAGSPVAGELLPSHLSEVIPPVDIAPGLPSEVLLRRPDVLQAEHLLRAAHADIGAARAAFFPRISLTTSVGTASTELSGLFAAGSGQWSYGAQMLMPAFDARTWWALKASRVQRELALANYEKAIQAAFREVSDALAAYGTTKRQLEVQQSMVNALANTHRLSLCRHAQGIDSYLKVLDAERALVDGQQALTSLQLATRASAVRLYAVLGGGWSGAEHELPRGH